MVRPTLAFVSPLRKGRYRGVFNMTEIFNKKVLRERRKELRHNMTKAEAILWTYIKGRKIEKQRFLRQFSIGGYIVDFYCPQLHLAIEVDGATHSSEEEIKYDKERQGDIEGLGIVFLRFGNEEIYGGLESVLHEIRSKVIELLNTAEKQII